MFCLKSVPGTVWITEGDGVLRDLPIRLESEFEWNKVLMIYLPVQVKAGNPAVSSMETRGFPTPPRDGCGFINFPFATGKQGTRLVN